MRGERENCFENSFACANGNRREKIRVRFRFRPPGRYAFVSRKKIPISMASVLFHERPWANFHPAPRSGNVWTHDCSRDNSIERTNYESNLSSSPNSDSRGIVIDEKGKVAGVRFYLTPAELENSFPTLCSTSQKILFTGTCPRRIGCIATRVNRY